MDRASRVAGGLVGLLVGDALGVPYEFHDPTNLPAPDAIELDPPADFRRSHLGIPVGTWSDDGAHALCLLASLLHRGRLDVADLANRLLDWDHAGYMAVDGRVFDIGVQTTTALGRLARATPPLQAGPSGERDNGNGSLMRALPLALWHRGTDAELAGDADLQSRLTHGHVRSRIACAVYCLWARGVLEGREDPLGQAFATVEVLYGPSLRHEVELLRTYPARGTGYVADTLASARVAVDAGPYEVAVRRAVAFGHDTDTTACVAGGIAGIRDGLEGIPDRWRDGLRGRELYQPLLDDLIARSG